MLSTQHRLTRDRDIRTVLRRGRVRRGRTLLVRCLQSRGGAPRFAVVVSTRVAKKATTRNRLKRQIRAALRALMPGVSSGIDVLVSALQTQKQPSYRDIYEELQGLLSVPRSTLKKP